MNKWIRMYKYNLFAHLRVLIFPNEQVSTLKRITVQQYLTAVNQINVEIAKIQSEADKCFNQYHQTDDLNWLYQQERCYVKLTAYSTYKAYHNVISGAFISAPDSRLSFAKLIDISGMPDMVMSPRERESCIAELVRVKSTFKDDFFKFLPYTGRS
jgi:hypothetical protein